MEVSKKIGWYRSMLGKLAHEEKMWTAAMKIAGGGKPDIKLPVDKGGYQKRKNVIKFGLYIEDAKLERQRRLEKERKQKSKKEIEND